MGTLVGTDSLGEHEAEFRRTSLDLGSARGQINLNRDQFGRKEKGRVSKKTEKTKQRKNMA